MLHEELTKRKQKSQESIQQYLYAISEIANYGDISEESIIDYVIRGINNDDVNKMILYGAHTLEELKNKLRIYMKYVIAPQTTTKDKTKKKKTNEVKSAKTVTKNTIEMKKERCFNCGRSEHKSDSCQDKEKCFNYDQFGGCPQNARVPDKNRINRTRRRLKVLM